MVADLTMSLLDRQNILNDQFAVTEIQRTAQVQAHEGALLLSTMILSVG